MQENMTHHQQKSQSLDTDLKNNRDDGINRQ